MIGDPHKRVYPLATERWPLKYDRNGHGVLTPSRQLPHPYSVWNRTGARRLDVRKEWRVYHQVTWNKREHHDFEQHQFMKFPPVEEQTKDWTILDATPQTLMTAGAAEEIKKDLKCAPFKPRFLVMNRDAFSRGYSQFVMEGDTLFIQTRRGKNFLKELEYQSTEGSLAKHKVCHDMMNEPEALMKDIRRVRLALQTCVYFQPPLYRDDAAQRNKIQQVFVNFLPYGFVALGLKYWLHVFDYDASLFRVVDTNTLKGLNGPQMMDMVEDVYDMKRMLPRCPTARSKEDEDGCTAWNRYDAAVKACGNQLRSYSGKADYTMGDAAGLKKYKDISDRWGKIMNDLIAEYNITRVVARKAR